MLLHTGIKLLPPGNILKGHSRGEQYFMLLCVELVIQHGVGSCIASCEDIILEELKTMSCRITYSDTIEHILGQCTVRIFLGKIVKMSLLVKLCQDWCLVFIRLLCLRCFTSHWWFLFNIMFCVMFHI